MIPVYIVTGLLESGKTTFIKETLMTQDWIDPGITLLLCCEEGEDEYPQDFLEYNDMEKVDIEDQDDYTLAFLKTMDLNHEPSQVVIEYNGMWDFEKFVNMPMPKDWEIQGVYTTINGETLDSYLKNMRKLVMEQTKESELIVVNRCPEDFNRGSFKRALTVQNPMAQVLFERVDGSIIEPTEEDLPYDVKGNKIVIEDEDFGTWYVDAYDHPERYQNKEISFLAQTFRPEGMAKNMFVPGRLIMTCCANDVRFYGYPCQSESNLSFNKGDWVKVNAVFDASFIDETGEARPMLKLLKIKAAKKPEVEVVMLT
ncbi:MAG TPA: hypothetical protein H9887_02335 [Candidatus Dorea intestinavium]|nr:hypothetical protein [Candidatus Dorea intestinavium]